MRLPAGRPRKFDPDAALTVAMHQFWRLGYEAVTIADLASRMGINPPSLYAAFGNKAMLFERVLGRYVEGPASYLVRALQQPTARLVASNALSGAIEMASDPSNARGCLLVHGALAGGAGNARAREMLAHTRDRAQAAVRKRLEAARDSGDLPPSACPDELAAYLMTVIWGLSVQAAGGASVESLHRTADVAMRSWPA